MGSNYEFIRSLVSDYDFICCFDIETDAEKIVLSDAWYEALYPGWEEENSFMERLEFIFQNLVDESEKDKFSKMCRKDVICSELHDNKVYYFNYKALINGQGIFYQMIFSFADEQKKKLVMGMHSVDREMRKQISMRSKHAQNKTLISVMNTDYSSVFYIDAITGYITSNSLKEETENLFSQYFVTGFSIKMAFQNFINEAVYEPDREKLRKLISDCNFTGSTNYLIPINVMFRYMKNEKPHYAELKFVRLEYGADMPPTAILGISDRESDIVGNFIDEQLEDDYIGICLVDLDEDIYYLRKNTCDALPRDTDGYCWSSEVRSFSLRCTEDTAGFVNEYNDFVKLRRLLKFEDRVEFLYKHDYHKEAQWRREVVQVVERRKGIPGSVIVTISILDKGAADREELNRQVLAQTETLENQHLTMERELKSAQAANDAKSVFLFNVSHDIRTPMNAIIGYTAMAKKYSAEQEKVEGCLEKIEMAGNQLLALVNQVLEMSRIESGKAALELSPTDVVERGYEIVTIVGTAARAKDIVLSWNVHDVVHRDVMADKGRMNQVMLNILGNAVKYTPEGGKIDFTLEEVRCNEPGKGIYIFTVKDNGIGMSGEFLEHIFDEFAREQSSTVSGIQGTGLGMAIVKRLVDLMGGSIDISSESGKGTTVCVRIEFALCDTRQKKKKPESYYDIERISGKRILLVEDNEMNREIAKDILEGLGIVVFEAEDGTEAVDIVKNAGDNDFDAILMDIQMPHMNGYEASRTIRKMDNALARIPIIAMTANAFIEDRQMAIDSGMNEHLAKPIDIDKLKHTLLKFL